MKIALVGGGIGGLTAALALSQSSHEITVFERSAGIREIGAGVQISPNASRLLHSLGLGEAYSEIAVYPQRVVLRRWEDDSILRSTDLDESFLSQHQVPLANVARNELVEILGNAVAQTKNVTLKFSTHVVGVEPGDSSSVVRFSDGTAQSFDIVVGADGIHSVVRPCVGGLDKPRFSGSAAYRALVPRKFVEDLPMDVTSTSFVYRLKIHGKPNHGQSREQLKTCMRDLKVGHLNFSHFFPELKNPFSAGPYMTANHSTSGESVQPHCWAMRATPCFRLWHRVRAKQLKMQWCWHVVSVMQAQAMQHLRFVVMKMHGRAVQRKCKHRRWRIVISSTWWTVKNKKIEIYFSLLCHQECQFLIGYTNTTR